MALSDFIQHSDVPSSARSPCSRPRSTPLVVLAAAAAIASVLISYTQGANTQHATSTIVAPYLQPQHGQQPQVQAIQQLVPQLQLEPHPHPFGTKLSVEDGGDDNVDGENGDDDSIEAPQELYPDIIDPGPPPPNSLRFGVLMPLNLSRTTDHYWRDVVVGAMSAIQLAVKDINAEAILPINISLSLRSSQPPEGSPRSGSNAMISAALFGKENISAVIGDTSSWLSEYSATLTSSLRIPQCSFSAISDHLSSKALYNYFFRTVPDGETIALQFLKYIQLMGWHRVGIIYTSDAFGTSLANAIVRHAPDFNVRVTISRSVYMPFEQLNAFNRTMDKFKELGSYVNLFLAADTELLQGMQQLRSLNMFNAPYVWITLNNIMDVMKEYYSVPGRPPVASFDGLIMADMNFDFTGLPAYDAFLARWLKLDPKLYPGGGPGKDLSHGETRAYACTWMLALGYKADIANAQQRGIPEAEILKQLASGLYPRTIGDLSRDLFSTIQYDGPYGRVELRDDGEPRRGSWLFYQVQDGDAKLVARTDDSSDSFIYPGTHVWHRFGLNGPKDGPTWVTQNLTWGHPLAAVFTAFAGLAMLVGLLLIGFVLWNRHGPIIKAASPFFCILEIVGILFTCIVIPMRVSVTSDALCYVVPLCALFGYSLLLSTLLVKNFRIYRIFNNTYRNKYAINDKKLLKLVLAAVLLFMVMPVSYVVVTRPRVQYVSIGATMAATMCVASNPNISGIGGQLFFAFTIIPYALLLLAAGYIAYKTQTVSDNWNESRAVGFSIYNLLFASIACIQTICLSQDLYRAALVIQNVLIIYSSFALMAILFVPKILAVRRQCGGRRESGFSGSGFSQRNQAQQGLGGSYGSELTFASLDPDIAFSKERGASLTFEQFEERLQEVTSKKNSVSYSLNGESISDGNGVSASSRPSLLANRLLSQEYQSFSTLGGPESYRVSEYGESIRFSESASRSNSGGGYGGAGTSGKSDDNQFRMGIFSFGTRDQTTTIPVMIEQRYRSLWKWHPFRQWQSMKVAVVTSLNLVILTELAKGASESFVYTNAMALTDGDHAFLVLHCLRDYKLRLEFPSATARDQWLRVFNVGSSSVDSASAKAHDIPAPLQNSSTFPPCSLPTSTIQQQQEQPRQLEQQQQTQLHQQAQQQQMTHSRKNSRVSTLWSYIMPSLSHSTALTSSVDARLPCPPIPAMTYNRSSVDGGVTGQSLNPPANIPGGHGGPVGLSFAEALGLDALGSSLPQPPSQGIHFSFGHKRRSATK